MKLRRGRQPVATVGIMGQDVGMGATHLAIALACYLAGHFKQRTALVELGSGGAFRQLSPLGNEDSFQRNNVEWHPSIAPQELGWIYHQDYSYIVLDLGADSQQARQELSRCHRRIITGSLSPWRRERYYSYIERMQQELGEIDMYTFVALFGDKIEIKHCRRAFKTPVKAVPFMADPFHADESASVFLHSLL